LFPRGIFRPYNETPTLKGPAMNAKEKFATAKEKIKDHAPEIIAFACAATAAYVILNVKKQFDTASGIFEPMTPVDDDTREQLMKDKDFLLYKLNENEYILDRPVPLV